MFARSTKTSLAALALFASSAALAAEPSQKEHAKSDEHAHHHHHEAGASLKLNDGKKWETDAALKRHMEAFQRTLAEKIPAIHDGKLKPEQYAKLAEELQKHLWAIMNECKLSPAADAQFHILLAEFFSGIEAMKKADMQGAVRVVRGLGSYADHFEHPGFVPLKHG